MISSRAIVRGIAVLACCLMAGCSIDLMAPGADDPLNADGGFGGSNEPIVHMPFPVGTSWLCTQGSNGSYSHQYDSTRYDLDFDTPNAPSSLADLFAPTAGTVRIHDDVTGFGRHVNIDRGDGTYVVLGHMNSFASGLSDGDFVQSGNYLGKAGCTGSCTGEHVHFGVHSGNAASAAGNGSSIPFRVFAQDTSGSGGAEPILSDDVVCGLSSGRWYESQLPVDGASSNDSSSDPHEDDPCEDDDDATDPPNYGDDDDATEPPNYGDDDDDDDDDDDAGPEDNGTPEVEICWIPAGLSNVHDVEMWVYDGGWNTVLQDAAQLQAYCAVWPANSGDDLIINGEYTATGMPSFRWWMCANDGNGLQVYGIFEINGSTVYANPVSNGVGGCDVEVTVL